MLSADWSCVADAVKVLCRCEGWRGLVWVCTVPWALEAGVALFVGAAELAPWVVALLQGSFVVVVVVMVVVLETYVVLMNPRSADMSPAVLMPPRLTRTTPVAFPSIVCTGCEQRCPLAYAARMSCGVHSR